MPASPPTVEAPEAKSPPTLRDGAQVTLDKAVAALLDLQHADGHWCAELEGDSILQSEYVLMKWIMGNENDPRLPAIVDQLRSQQRPDGGWGQYPGGELGGGKFDLSATVKAYLCLKLHGDDPEADHMRKARELVLAHGGAERVNSFSKFYLAALGQVSWKANPSIPPEIVYLPKWFYFHLDKVSAWSRTMITPLSIVTTYRPVRDIPKDKGIDEMYVSQRDRHRLIGGVDGHEQHPFWSRFFLVADKFLKVIDKFGMTPWRKRALQRIEDWIVKHTEDSDGPGAIFPPIVYLLIALQCRGYKGDHPLMKAHEQYLVDYMIDAQDENGDTRTRLQPCFSPVWDTGIAAYALAEAGLPKDHPAIRKCVHWLLEKECRFAGDWQNNIDHNRFPNLEPAGWFFEYRNKFYPDVDDTVMVAMALKRLGEPGSAAHEAAERGVRWVFAMQNPDHGWAAFDRDACDRPIMEYIPFADHNAIQDPSCADITGRTLECLGHMGFNVSHPAVQRAIEFNINKQEPEGPWFGRWGVNYIYGTWQAVCGLRLVGQDMDAEWVQRAGQWLKSVQRTDGSFGESADSYEDRSLMGQGPPTASQTAWGAMAMLAIFGPEDPDVQRAIRWLIDTQLSQDDDETGDKAGSWREDWFTGTGFPKVFYLRYHLYRLYFPIMAIGRWLNAK